jgi:hypothetical protein
MLQNLDGVSDESPEDGRVPCLSRLDAALSLLVAAFSFLVISLACTAYRLLYGVY